MYLVFGGPEKDYSDHGGWFDYAGRADTFEEARILTYQIACDQHGTSGEWTWCHIVDLTKGCIVWCDTGDITEEF